MITCFFVKSDHVSAILLEDRKAVIADWSTRLTWKPHLEAVEAKATRKLAIMKKLAGTTWGANSDILKQVYTGAVRPVVEYASTVWDTASKKNKKQKQKQARQSAEHGPENDLRCYEKYTNQTNGKDYRPSTFRVQT